MDDAMRTEAAMIDDHRRYVRRRAEASTHCARCGSKSCRFACPCGTPYCSEKCQRDDWPDHSKIKDVHRSTIAPTADSVTPPIGDPTIADGTDHDDPRDKLDHANVLFFPGMDRGKPAACVGALCALRRMRFSWRDGRRPRASLQKTIPIRDMFHCVAGCGMGALLATIFCSTDDVDVAIGKYAYYTGLAFGDSQKMPDETRTPNPERASDFPIPERRDVGAVPIARTTKKLPMTFVDSGLRSAAAFATAELFSHSPDDAAARKRCECAIFARDANVGDMVAASSRTVDDDPIEFERVLTGAMSRPGRFPPRVFSEDDGSASGDVSTPRKKVTRALDEFEDVPFPGDLREPGVGRSLFPITEAAERAAKAAKKTSVCVFYPNAFATATPRDEVGHKFEYETPSGVKIRVVEIVIGVEMSSSRIESRIDVAPRLAYTVADGISEGVGADVFKIKSRGCSVGTSASCDASQKDQTKTMRSAAKYLVRDEKTGRSIREVSVVVSPCSGLGDDATAASVFKKLMAAATAATVVSAESDRSPPPSSSSPGKKESTAVEANVGAGFFDRLVPRTAITAGRAVATSVAKWAKAQRRDPAAFVTDVAIPLGIAYVNMNPVASVGLTTTLSLAYTGFAFWRSALKSAAPYVGQFGKMIGDAAIVRRKRNREIIDRVEKYQTVGGDACIIAKWTYLVERESWNTADRIETEIEYAFSLVKSRWVDEQHRATMIAYASKYKRIANDLSEYDSRVEAAYGSNDATAMILYGWAENPAAKKLRADPELMRIFMRELGESSPFVVGQSLRECGAEVGAVTNRTLGTFEEPQFSWGGRCEWTFRNEIMPLFDGNSTFSAMAKAIRESKYAVYIAGWEVTLGLPMERDDYGGTTTLGNMLAACAARGVEVYVMAWRGGVLDVGADLIVAWKNSLARDYADRIHVTLATNPEFASLKEISHLSHHQKIVIVDDSYAFVGGLDVTTNRWDTFDHPCMPTPSATSPSPRRAVVPANFALAVGIDVRYTGFDYYSPALSDVESMTFRQLFRRSGTGRIVVPEGNKTLRDLVIGDAELPLDTWLGYRRRLIVLSNSASSMTPLGKPSVPRMGWHDVSLRLSGSVVRQVFEAYARRWEHATENGNVPAISQHVVGRPAPASTCACLVLQSLPMGTRGHSERGIRNAYVSAIACAKRFVYIEQQYFSVFLNYRVAKAAAEIDGASVGAKQDLDAITAAYEDVFGKAEIEELFAGMNEKRHKSREDVDLLTGRLNNPFDRDDPKMRYCDYEDIIRAGDTASGIGSIVAWRLRRAVLAGEKFAVRVVVPAYPDGFGAPETFDVDDAATFSTYKRLMMMTMALQYLSTAYMHRVVESAIAARSESVKNRVDVPKNPEDYFQVYCLRSVGEDSDGFPVTEQIYPHVKCLITDGVVVCGSANLNERSMSGYRDTEIAVLVASPEFASTMVRTLTSEHTDGASQNWWETTTSTEVDDPFAKLNALARKNTDVLVEVFDRAIPEADVETTSEYRKRRADLESRRVTHAKLRAAETETRDACGDCEQLSKSYDDVVSRYGAFGSENPMNDEIVKIQMQKIKACAECEERKKRAAAMRERLSSSSGAMSVESMKEKLASSVRGHLTIAPRRWMRKDLAKIGGFGTTSISSILARETVKAAIEPDARERMTTLSATMLELVQ